jgi:molybdopterin synthase sulfur carrier subunit
MIKLLFFAQLREVLDCHHLELPLVLPITVAALKSQLAQRGDRWQMMFTERELLCAINQVIGDDTQTVRAGDEVAFFPPVTGG